MSTDDELARKALSRSPLSTPGPSPDKNALVAWASGSLDAPAADAGSAASDGAGVGGKGASMGGAAGAGPGRGSRRGGRPRSGPGSRWVAIAAAVLLLTGAGVFLATRRGPSPDAELSAAHRVVAVAAGPSFAARSHLDAAELQRGQPTDAARGGLVVLRPRGVVFGTQPFLAWTAVPGATSYAVTVRNAEGRVLWRADAEERLTIPSDPAAVGGAAGEGRVVEVTAEGALGRTIARSTFTFATAVDRAALDRARAATPGVEPALRVVSLAHLAARAGWWELALALAEGAPGRHISGTPAHAISTFARKSLGLPLQGEVPHGDR